MLTDARRKTALPAILLLTIAAMLPTACMRRTETQTDFSGFTMGTSYSVRLAHPPATLDLDLLRAQIEAELLAVNASMSTYDPDSELSRFNRSQDAGWIPVSEGLVAVVTAAQAISARTDGAFDVTAAPLVDLWGFGPEASRSEPPAPELLRLAMARVGYEALQVRSTPPALRKLHPDLSVDLSAIAKGYGVDRLAALLDRNGVTNYLVEIGGELRILGRRADDGPWRVGIEKPTGQGRSVQRIIPLDGAAAVATSGDYRNFFDAGGQHYAHIIDPRTGWPAQHNLASVTVIAEDCSLADGWATALSVLGAEAGLQLAEQLGLAALFIERSGDSFTETSTAAFAARIAPGQAL